MSTLRNRSLHALSREPGNGLTDDPFVSHRGLLFTVAYELLGSAADAEDMVQETWLRWSGIGADGQAEVSHPRAYLVRIVSRLALNRLRTMARRKEDYVGEWLPEPLLTTPDVAEDVELAENVSIAMLTVLETLTPTERAVFVLREVFDLPFDEIAAATGKSAAAARQIAHRARSHVAARRPRVRVDRAEQQRAVDRFLTALRTGDLQGLMDALAPDAVLIADGGGVVAAARNPVAGAKKIVNLLGPFSRVVPDAVVESVVVNGTPGARIIVDGTVDTVISFAFDGERISRIFGVRNPEKLHRLGMETSLRRY
jgi:RNA polymerase sigma-70 factor (ECF subfamily)